MSETAHGTGLQSAGPPPQHRGRRYLTLVQEGGPARPGQVHPDARVDGAAAGP